MIVITNNTLVYTFNISTCTSTNDIVINDYWLLDKNVKITDSFYYTSSIMLHNQLV